MDTHKYIHNKLLLIQIYNTFVYCVDCELMHFIQDLATVQPWNKILM